MKMIQQFENDGKSGYYFWAEHTVKAGAIAGVAQNCGPVFLNEIFGRNIVRIDFYDLITIRSEAGKNTFLGRCANAILDDIHQ